MSQHKTLHELAEEIESCVKCGVCQAHCPTYNIWKKEGTVARGKVALAASLMAGDINVQEALSEMKMCLMCGSCLDKCPNNVPTPEIVGAVRRMMVDEQVQTPANAIIGKGVSTLLGSPKLMKSVVKTSAVLAPHTLKKIPNSSGLKLRFPFPMAGRTVPNIPPRNLFDRVEEISRDADKKPLVGFFAGCSITYCYPEIGEKMVRILERLGYAVCLPKNQRCCGIPALSSGDGKLVEELAQANVSAFAKNVVGKEVQAIITACASCNGGTHEYYSQMKGSYNSFTKKIIDFTQFLEKEDLFKKLSFLPKWEQPKRVCYHDPCHLKVQQITREPRKLLKSMPNVDFVEMENAAKCCGFGGTFSVYNYETSKEIGKRKVEGIKSCRAEMVATGCPGCIMQLQDSINYAELEVKAVHILDLLDDALENYN